MRSRSVQVEGKSVNGKLKISQTWKVAELMKKWPNSDLIVEVKVLPKEASKLIIARYWHKVVPTFQQGYKEVMGELLTFKQVDYELRKLSPVCSGQRTTDSGILDDGLRSIYELSGHEVSEFMRDIEILAAQEFNIVL